MWYEEKGKVTEGTESYKTVILGDSRAKSSLMPLISDENGGTYNLAIGGTTAVEMYYAFDNYMETHAAPENAVIIFAPYHFCDADNFDQTLYYNYLSVPEIIELYSGTFMYKDGEDIRKKLNLPDILSYKLRFPNKYMAALIDSRFNGNLTENTAKLKGIEEELGYTYFGTDEENNEPNYETHHKSFDSSDIILSYYDRLLTRLDKEGVNVVIEQAPVNPVSDEETTDDFYAGYEEMLNRIEKEHPRFTVVKKVPVYEADKFGDNNHLNARGAEVYSEYFRKTYGF
ncbi:MAG: DUF1574 domain-containing protein [Lachnospiraceae bacterium]|nr:DUF1574 domain-containing protein [Lachnospiraceae bacterium]